MMYDQPRESAGLLHVLKTDRKQKKSTRRAPGALQYL